MNKILLATTALVAGTVMFSQPATAQVRVSAAGYTQFTVGVFDDDFPNNSGRDFQLEAELDIMARGRMENGVDYGAEIQLRNDGGDCVPGSPTLCSGEENLVNVDQAFLYFGGNFGRFELGDVRTVTDKNRLEVRAPTVLGYEQVDGDYQSYLLGGPIGVHVIGSGDSSKVSYITPRIVGFQAGVSYAPEINEGQSVVRTDTFTATAANPLGRRTYEDWIEGTALFRQKFDEFEFAIGGSAVTADSKDDSVTGLQLLEDFTAWNAGVNVGWGGFTVGAAYVDNDEFGHLFGVAGQSDSDGFNVGVAFRTETWEIAASWLSTGKSSVLGNNYRDFDAYGIGGIYKIAEGIMLQSDLMFSKAEVDIAGGTNYVERDGWVFLVGFSVDF